MTGKRKRETVDEKNRKAPQLNPSKSGIRSGNPQLDPDSVRNEEERPQTPNIPRHARRRPGAGGAPQKKSP